MGLAVREEVGVPDDQGILGSSCDVRPSNLI